MDIQETKAYLKTNKITYEQLAERSKIPLNTLKNIFSGRTRNPRIDTMQAIEEALDLNQPAKIGWTDEEKAAGVTMEETLSADETEWIDLYRALKGEKGTQTVNAIKTMMKNLLEKK